MLPTFILAALVPATLAQRSADEHERLATRHSHHQHQGSVRPEWRPTAGQEPQCITCLAIQPSGRTSTHVQDPAEVFFRQRGHHEASCAQLVHGAHSQVEAGTSRTATYGRQPQQEIRRH